MEMAVREGSFTTHAQTVSKYHELPGEPEDPEYRVAVQDECDHRGAYERGVGGRWVKKKFFLQAF